MATAAGVTGPWQRASQLVLWPFRTAFTRFLSVVLVVVFWEAAARSGAVTPFMLPALSTVLERIWTDATSGELLRNIGLTVYRALAGFAIAGVAGVVLGLAIPRSRFVHWLLDPIISVAFPMPKIVFLPIVTLWLGFGEVPKIFMVVIDSVLPVITATVAGTLAAERELLWSARSMGATEREVWREVVLPSALPQILTGMQVALPIAMIVVVVSEMVMGGGGLGAAMIAASRFADSPGVFAGLVEIGLVGYCIVKAVSLARRRMLIWHAETLAPATV
jgi:ABC-type nitrate/sulfonate/bicarbonate transport system permease component